MAEFAKGENDSMNRIKVRNAFRTVHLWMGLGSGIVIFLVCLSGTIYTFRAEIERWMEPGKYYASGIEGKSDLDCPTTLITTDREKA